MSGDPGCVFVSAAVLDVASSYIAVDLCGLARLNDGVRVDGRQSALRRDHSACLLGVLNELAVGRNGECLVELHLEHGDQAGIRVHGCSSLIVGHVLLNDRIGDHVEVELGRCDDVEAAVLTGLNELLLQIEDDLTKVVHAGGAGEIEVLEVITRDAYAVGNLGCVVGVCHCEQGFLCEQVEGLHCDEGVLLGVVRDDGINNLEVYLIGELHVTTILVGLDLILLDGALIGHGRYAFSQRSSMRLQGCPSTELQLICLVANGLGVSETEVYVLVCIQTDGVEQLLIIENFRIDNARACLGSKLKPGVDICGCVQKHGGISTLRHRSTLLVKIWFFFCLLHIGLHPFSKLLLCVNLVTVFA